MANTVEKVISIATAEVGYLEKKNNSQLDSKTANSGSNNYTKYWRDLAPGMQAQSWCNAFVNWCFIKAYGESSAKKLLCTSGAWSYYTPTSASYFKTKSQWYTSKPQVGDIIYFKNSTRIHHVGLVYKVDSKKVYTIEGNTSGGSSVVANGGGVAKKEYVLTNSAIAGYGRPKYDVAVTATTTQKTTTATTNKYTKDQFVKDLKNIYKLNTVTNAKLATYLPLITTTTNKKHASVLPLQKYLNALGYNCGTPDCEFGSKSASAIRAYQAAQKLSSDGKVGQNTWKKLLGV